MEPLHRCVCTCSLLDGITNLSAVPEYSIAPLHLDALSIGTIANRLEGLIREKRNPVPLPLDRVNSAHRALTFFKLLPGSVLRIDEGHARWTPSHETTTSRDGEWRGPWVVVQAAGNAEIVENAISCRLATDTRVPLDSALYTFDFFRELLFSAEWAAIADPRSYEALYAVYALADFEWDGNPEDVHPAPCRLHSTVNITLEPGCVVLESSTGDSFFRGFSGVSAGHIFQNENGEVHVRMTGTASSYAGAGQAAILTRDRIRIWSVPA